LTALPDHGTALLGEVSERWRAADPLLPEPHVPAPGVGCGAVFTLVGADGQPLAVGTCEHWRGEPEALELTWGAARRFRLAVLVGGADVAAALDGLLGLWRVHLAGVPGADDPDSAAVINWPSRDVDGVRILLRRGYAPRAVIAARTADRRVRPGVGQADPADLADSADLASDQYRAHAPRGIRVRRAGGTDIDTVVRLGLEVIRYDARFGGVVERPSTAAALRDDVTGLLAEPEPWIWLAERDGAAVGVLIAEPPHVAQWIAPLVGPAPVAYNTLTFVSPENRGTGAADALVSRFHDAAAAAGVPVTTLHYEQTNPLSVPFWSRQGYRPLWTSFEARPACAVR
jgi:GNAT superfamily N-acetyltransferase